MKYKINNIKTFDKEYGSQTEKYYYKNKFKPIAFFQIRR